MSAAPDAPWGWVIGVAAFVIAIAWMAGVAVGRWRG